MIIIYSNDNRPTFQNNISGIIITDVADHFGTFHIVSKCKQTPVQTYSQIRQMKTDNILKFNNILANEDYTSVLLADCPNYAYHSFMEIYTNAFNRACPVKSIKTPKKYIKREPWVTNGILTSSLTKSKLLKRKLKKPTEQNINAFKKYCIIFDKVKKMAKESYFNLELELNKKNLKKTWEILRQAIHKQNNRPTIPDTFIINGKSNSNINEIAEEFNNFFVNIGEQTAKNLPHPTNSFSDYLNGNYAANLFMFPTCEAEILHTTTHLKASTSEGFDNISTQILKQTMKEVATPLTHIVNLSLSHGIFPNDMKLAKIVPVFKNGNTKLFNNYRPISILPAFSKILEKIVCNRLLHFLETKYILYKHQYGFRKKSQHYPSYHSPIKRHRKC